MKPKLPRVKVKVPPTKIIPNKKAEKPAKLTKKEIERALDFFGWSY